jgi:peptidoglycan/xylan/chitin deacetylase (PgdA/CDA1 family)
VKRALASRWGWPVAGRLVRAPGVIVLMYHRILGDDRSLPGTPAEHFAAHMRWIRERCDPIHPDELRARALRGGRHRRPAVLVTFDDGYRDYHDRAWPVLRGLGIPAAVFLATAFMDEGGTPWTDELRWAAMHSRSELVRAPWSDEPVALRSDAGSRAALGERACAHLKRLPDGERRAALAALLAELGDVPRRERQMLTWDEVRRTMDVTTYGGHSHTHPILSRLARDECEREIRTCRDRITAETGRAPRYFAYPNGQPEDYTPETQELLRRHAFEVAFATSEGVAADDADWMAVRRIHGAGADGAELAWTAAIASRPSRGVTSGADVRTS